MAHDPELVAETKSWLVKAAKDLAAAVQECQAHPPLLEDVVFHAQQAVEKALKGFLTWHRPHVPKDAQPAGDWRSVPRA